MTMALEQAALVQVVGFGIGALLATVVNYAYYGLIVFIISGFVVPITG